MLRLLTWVQHALVAALLVVCTARALSTGAHPVPTLLGAGAFAAFYVAGAARSRRPSAHGPERSEGSATSGDGAGRAARSRRAARWMPVLFLVGLTALWVGLVVLSPDFVWLAFSLWLLAGHFLRWGWAVAFTAATLAVVVGAPWLAGGGLRLAEVAGPLIGALFALVMSRGQVELVRDARERTRLLEDLLAAQRETDRLTEQLAAAQRRAGAAAERSRLSRDIHDTLAQGFSSLVLLARAGARTEDPGALRAMLARVERTASENLAEARRVVADLAPQALGETGLPAALRRIVEAFEADTGVRAEIRWDTGDEASGDAARDGHGGAPVGAPSSEAFTGLPTPVEVALVRTAQGALANVRAHARASRVVVTLSDVGDAVILDVVDDGVGFDPATLGARRASTFEGGYGLPGIRARLRELGGTVTVESAPGAGTALNAVVPLGPTAIATAPTPVQAAAPAPGTDAPTRPAEEDA